MNALLVFILGAQGSARAAGAPALPVVPMLRPTTAATAPVDTLLVGGGLAGGWTGRARGGAFAQAAWWPQRRLLATATVAQGVAETGCVGCPGTVASLGLRGAIVDRPALRLGATGALDATASGGLAGSASLGLAAEGGTGWLRLDAGAPVLSTVDLLEDARTGWQTGLSLHAGPRHATRLGTVGPRFRPTLQHRWAGPRAWAQAGALWDPAGPLLRLSGGWRW